jgi:hypothetical protein
MQPVIALIKIASGVTSAAISTIWLYGILMYGSAFADAGRSGHNPRLLVRTLTVLAMLFCGVFTARSGIIDFRGLFSRSSSTAAS